VLFTGKPAAEHDGNVPTEAWMERIADSHLKRRTPGIVTLLRTAWARAGSLAPSATRRAGRTSPSSTPAFPACSPISLAHGDARYARLLRSLARVKLLILDDWGPEALNADQARDLLEIIEDRYDKGSIVITSQVPVARWHDLIGEQNVS